MVPPRALIGVIYWATRSEPEGAAGAAGMIRLEEDGLHVGVPTLKVARLGDAGGRTHSALEANLLQIRF